jgi:hypothetical protein
MPAEGPSPAEPAQITVIRDADDLPAIGRRLRELADPDGGIVVLRPVPYSGSINDFLFCVLEGLGKRLPARLSSPQRPWDQAKAWVTGYRLAHLVIDRAHTMPAEFAPYLRALLGPPRPHRTRLWLIDASRTTTSSVITAFGRDADSQVTTADPQQLDRIRPRPPATTRTKTIGEPIPDDLPADNFLTFRAACIHALDRNTAARLDQLWLKTFQTARTWLRNHRKIGEAGQAPDQLALPLSIHLAARLYRCASDGEALVRLRATQAAFLRDGLLLHHQARPGDPGLGHRLTPTAVAAINRATIATAPAAAATLFLLFPFDRRGDERYWHPSTLTMDDVTSTASGIRINDEYLPVPAHARPALAAHLAFRQMQGPRHPGDPFFDLTPPHDDLRTLADRALTATTAAGDTPVDRVEPPAGHGTLWMRQRRLVLRNLVGNAHTLDLSAPVWT